LMVKMLMFAQPRERLYVSMIYVTSLLLLDHSSTDILASEQNPAFLSWISGYECIFSLGLLY
jgi:hypothetical protein